MHFTRFVLSHLPPPPARVLEVGCGNGALTQALADAGHDALGIDPAAPPGPLFRRLKLEDLEQRELFDAVVASAVLHHVTDIDLGLDRVVAHLRERGLVLVDEFSSDLLDDQTAEWFWSQRRRLAAARGEPAETLDDCWHEWRADHVGLHGYVRLRDELDARFEELHFSWQPYLYRLLGGAVTEALERGLIESGAIRAVGWRYVGVRS